MSSCTSCDKAFVKGDLIVSCHVCLDFYHATDECAGVSYCEIKTLQLKKRKPILLYTCPPCRENNNIMPGILETLREINSKLDTLNQHSLSIANHEERLDVIDSTLNELKLKFASVSEILTDISELKVDVKNLNNQFTIISNSNSSTSTTCSNSNTHTFSNTNNFYDSMKEYKQREKRLLNVILYNVEENNEVADYKKLNDIIKPIQISTVMKNDNCIRLGKRTNSTCRPILIKMKNRTDVTNVLKNWRQFKGENINVSPDLTHIQRDITKVLRAKAKEWNAAHPDQKKTVILIKGDPTLVDDKRRDTTFDGGTSDE